MASKMSAPKLPRLEMVKVPDWNSSGASCLARARFTRSAQLRLICATPHASDSVAGMFVADTFECRSITCSLTGDVSNSGRQRPTDVHKSKHC